MSGWRGGFLLWAVARWQWGGWFSVTEEAMELVTMGSIRRSDIPSMCSAGLGRWYGSYLGGNWIVTVLLLALGSLQILRIKREEMVLLEAFGEEDRR
jgi:protein-S-isoprenylcysteine O-methyltransferase Ste14